MDEIMYKDSTMVYPCVLYTSMKCPIRIKDLAWISPELRQSLFRFALDITCHSSHEILLCFIRRLHQSISLLHEIGGVNDSLRYDNVTLAAELVDLEWLYVPGVSLPDGSSNEILDERQKKEWIYFLEICQAAALSLDLHYSFHELLDMLSSPITWLNKCH